jgi:hypothetical protein
MVVLIPLCKGRGGVLSVLEEWRRWGRRRRERDRDLVVLGLA